MTHQPLIDAFADWRCRAGPDPRFYVAGCSGEPRALHAALQERPELAAGVTFLGIWIPGVNRLDWAGLHPGARAETIFLSPDWQESFSRGRMRFLPLNYVQAWRWLTETPLHGGIVLVAPPGDEGHCSLGVSADFSGAVLDRPDVPLIGLASAAMPAPASSPRYDMMRFSAMVEDDTPLTGLASANLPPAFAAIGAHIAALVPEGATLQFGLGNVQQAVLDALGSHRDLRILAGMISEPLRALLAQGAVADQKGAITTGVALGSPELYAQIATDRRAHFAPVSHTHAHATLSAIDGLVAINSVIEVDLFGQANAEFLNRRQVSGAGGLVNFLRGAGDSRGGRAVTALCATARGGTRSRIVPRLAPNAVSVARADMGTVVTEHGHADLGALDIDARAEALIAIADPAFRDTLSNEWDAMRRAM